MQDNRYDAIIIGAGHNGLVTACYLAKAGWKVLALERRVAAGAGGRAQVGGELPLQVPDQQVDAQFRGWRGLGHLTRRGW